MKGHQLAGHIRDPVTGTMKNWEAHVAERNSRRMEGFDLASGPRQQPQKSQLSLYKQRPLYKPASTTSGLAALAVAERPWTPAQHATSTSYGADDGLARHLHDEPLLDCFGDTETCLLCYFCASGYLSARPSMVLAAR